MTKRLLVALLGIGLMAAACGGSSDDSTAADDSTATDDSTAADDSTATDDSTAADDTGTDDDGTADDDAGADAPPAEPATELHLATSELGDILVDGAGLTLYLFTPDAQGPSTCYNDCELAWPVVGEVSSVGEGLDAGLLGTTERNDGSLQATYNGWPLYYFSADTAPGETKGQGANAVWYVLDASGNAIE